jgi:hypothetical protein
MLVELRNRKIYTDPAIILTVEWKLVIQRLGDILTSYNFFIQITQSRYALLGQNASKKLIVV